MNVKKYACWSVFKDFLTVAWLQSLAHSLLPIYKESKYLQTEHKSVEWKKNQAIFLGILNKNSSTQ